MRGTILFLALFALPASAGILVSDARVSWAPFSPPDLNLFVGAVNRTLDYIAGLGVTVDVPRLGELKQLWGISISEGLGFGPFLALDLAALKTETGTQGVLVEGDTERAVDISLALQVVQFGLLGAFPALDPYLWIGGEVGFGLTTVAYHGRFDYSGDWNLSFVPPAEDLRCRAMGLFGGAFLRLSLPVVPGLSTFLEGGWRWGPLGIPACGEKSLDLNGDGRGDYLDLSGMWLALGVHLGLAF
ncbi:MAG TPA: hypothetical protein ENF77_06385 [Candidatus Acetothermia bacterium]|nr:hypothetical protein [Candidatus Acetothermia bacterium]